MATLQLKFKPVESQGNFQESVMGTFADVLNHPDVETWRPTSKGRGVLVFNKTGEFETLNFSKPLNAALEEGTITFDQLGQCQVINGKNASGEARVYITLPGLVLGGNFSAKKAAADMAKAAAITPTKSTALSAQAMKWII